MTTYDAIIIGGGHNGLTTAALLAARGRAVVVLERSETLGGLAIGPAFHDGFTSVGLLHDTSGVRPHVVETLGLERHGLTLDAASPPVFTPQPEGDGPGLLLHRDPGNAAAEIGGHSTRDAGRYGEYRAFLDRIRPFLTKLCDTELPEIGPGVASLLSLAGRGVQLRRLGRRDMLEILRIGPMCLADWLNEWFENELLSGALAAPALDGTRAGPWSPGTVANLLRLEALAGPSVRGGPLALIDALEAAARQHGAELRVGAEVQTIRTSGGAVEGVTLAGGETIDAPVVVATCDPKRTLLELVGAAAISPTLDHRIGALRTRGAIAKVDLALRGALRFACRPELEIERAGVVAPTLDGIEQAYDAVKYRRCSETPILDVLVPTVARPDLAPDAEHAVVSVVVQFAPHDLDSGWTDAARDALGDAVVATLDRHAPGLAGRIVGRQVLSPVDIEARYGVTGGHVHHVEHALDQMIVRPAPQCERSATPVRGLYLGGSGSHPGGGLTCGPGAFAAAAVLGSKAR